MRTTFKPLLATLLGAFILTGCQPYANLGANTSATPLSIISEESQKALVAQQSLKNATEESNRTLIIRQSKINEDILNVNYIGLPEPLLESVALHFGYRYLESGRATSLPIVNFTNRKITGLECVKDVATFVGNRADITVDHQNKTIVLTYKSL